MNNQPKGITNNSRLTPKGENGNATCATPDTADGPNRRLINFVVIDCVQNAFNGHATGIPVTTYVQGLLTEPVNNPPSPTIFLEIVDVIRPGSPPGILHELVQLYR